MGRSELWENLIFTAYCIYRIFIAIDFIAQNAKFASENNIYGWIENHNWRKFLLVKKEAGKKDPVEQNYMEGQHQLIKLPFFIRCEKQKEDGKQCNYDINYNDNPYKSSII
ncbi:unnamed protein product [Cercopithifilaria johnstoni]|uniref:Uncharacterized protein n=1 Tax=Cercopithifilaria johnstoni TaxID=2874296 RepID=A0A8J2Q306_9BILA|nr:unnamed protein product [Cercopithifilaria johnstoni]